MFYAITAIADGLTELMCVLATAKRSAVLICVLLASQWSVAQDAAMTPHHLDCFADVYPPYTVQREGGVSGIAVDLLQEAGRRVGLDVTVKVLPFARITNELKRGAASPVACAYAFSRTTERELTMLFGTVPASTTRYVLYAKSGVGNSYTGAAALRGARIGVRLAFRVPEAIKQAAERGELTLETVNNDEFNFRKLGLGRVDYVLTNEDVGETMILRLKLEDTHALRPAVEEFATYMVFNKAMEQAPALRNALDKGMQAVRADDTEKRIRAQYLR